MSDDITLSPKHGVNPCIPLCAFCGEEKNQIALLGKLRDDKEAPKYAVIDAEPCDNCKDKIDTEGYLGFIGDCGHSGLIRADVFDSNTMDKLQGNTTFRIDKCWKCAGKDDD